MDNIKLNKVLNEKYYLLQDVAKKYSYSDDLLCMITLIYISFYMDLGKKCDLPLYDLFDQVRIIYENGGVGEISQKYGFGSLSSGTAAVTMFNPNLKVFENPSLKQNPQTILLGTQVNNYLATEILKLEMLTHEVRHALTGYYNTNILLDEDTYFMRTGLQEKIYHRKKGTKDEFDFESKGVTLDEVLNTYITENLIYSILSLKNIKISNNNIRKYLDRLKTEQLDGRYRVIGYNSEVRLLNPLLQNHVFVNLVDEHQFDGDIDIVKDFITNNSNHSNYDDICGLLDTIYSGNERYLYMQKNGKIDEDFANSHIKNIRKMKDIVLDLNSNIGGKVLVKK